MNSGKSTALLQAAFNYEERGLRILLAKPRLDTKGQSLIVSRLGVERETDFTVGADEDVYARFVAERAAAGTPIACLLIDEAQFLSETQVDDLLRIAVIENVPVLAYGIRTDFQTIAFPGSRRLLEVAHSIEELKTICRCGRKAVCNARTIGGRFVFDGDQVAIDGVDASYESLCGACYLDESGGVLNNSYRARDEFASQLEPDADFA
jgi:thymidine kinase